MKKIITLLLCVSFLFSFAPVFAEASEPEGRGFVYIATNGNDSNAGTIDKPLKTFEAAKNKVRSMKKSGEFPKGITVYVRGGDYNINKGLVLTEEDSGTETAPITWRNYMDEKVTLVGGASISGKDFQKVSDPAILERVVEAGARDKIYMVDLKKYGITDVGDRYLLGSYGYNSTVVEGGAAKMPKAPAAEFFFNGKPLTIARYPNSDYMTIEAVIDKGFTQSNGLPVTHGFTVKIADERIKKWTKAPEDSILLYGYWVYEWADQTIPLKSINVERNEFTSSWGTPYGVNAGINFYAFDLIEELDAKGEYYIDRENCIVYVIPPEDIEKAEIKLSVLEDELFRLEKTNHITIRGFDITSCRNTAIMINKGSHNKVTDCEISYTANRSVQINGGFYNGITDCYIHDTEGAIYLDGGYDYKDLVSSNNYALNNHVENFSRLSGTYMGGITMRGNGTTAAFNEIHGGPHLAIDFSGVNQKILYNEIYDVLRSTDDAGAIYGGLRWDNAGLEIKYNHIHDIVNTGSGTLGLFAIYFDGGNSGGTIIGNVCENVEGRGIQIGGGRYNTMLNNYFINCKSGIIIYDVMKSVNLNTYHYPRLEEINKNVDLENNEKWKEAFPYLYKILSLSDEEKKEPRGNVMKNNVAIGSPVIEGVVAGSYNDITQNLEISGDPGFVDMKGGDYNLKPDSALSEKLPGFKAIPFSRIGRYDDRAQNRIANAVVMRLESPHCYVKGTMSTIDENESVMPFVENGRTYVPLRFISEALGAAVDYNEGIVTVNSADVNLTLNLASGEATKNGEAITLENMPKVIHGRTMIPLREVSELLDKKVFWHDRGLISISDMENLFDEGGTDEEIILHLYDKLSIY